MTASELDRRSRLMEVIAKRPSPTRAQWQRRSRWTWAGGVSMATLTAAGWFRVPAPEQLGWVVGSVLVFLALAWLTGSFFLRRGTFLLGPSRQSMQAAVLLAVTLPALAALVLGRPSVEPRRHVACALLTLVIGAGPFLAGLLVRRGSDYVRPRVTGAVIGAFSGAVGGLGISLHCFETQTAHLLFGHVLPIAVFALLGGALGERMLGANARL